MSTRGIRFAAVSNLGAERPKRILHTDGSKIPGVLRSRIISTDTKGMVLLIKLPSVFEEELPSLDARNVMLRPRFYGRKPPLSSQRSKYRQGFGKMIALDWVDKLQQTKSLA